MFKFFCQVVRESGQFLQHLFTILDQLEIDVSQDYSEFILALSQLYKTHPHDSIKKVTRRLLFPTPDPYIQLFAHVSCETPGKYQPGHVVSLLCNVVTQQPRLDLSCSLHVPITQTGCNTNCSPSSCLVMASRELWIKLPSGAQNFSQLTRLI